MLKPGRKKVFDQGRGLGVGENCVNNFIYLNNVKLFHLFGILPTNL